MSTRSDLPRQHVPAPHRESVQTDPATDFTPQRATLWLEPGLLARTAREALVSGVLGQYNDKRESMAPVEADGYLDLRRTGPLWMDYVSDTGDGFDATYAVAALVGRPGLRLRDPGGVVHDTARGDVLVLGGDECYPAGSIENYENRLTGPYRASLPQAAEASAPYLFAVPGNHDWYDGLTSFMRTFCQGRWIGGWRTTQARSYFAARLPAGWWLWAIDIQFDTYIDDHQLRYFRALAEELHPGDGVVLCTAKPSWVAATDEDCEAYATLDFFERTIVRPTGASVRVMLTGDRHHYVRYAADDGAQKITAGGGGAYLSPTHHLPSSLLVPPPECRARGRSTPVPYERTGVYPDPQTSRRRGWGVLALPWRCPGFAALIGTLHALLALTVGVALREPAVGLAGDLRATAAALREAGLPRLLEGLLAGATPLLVAVLAVLAAVGFTQQAGRWRGRLLGVVHGSLHVLLALVVLRATIALLPVPGAWLLLVALPVVLVVGGALGAELVALYLLVADRFRMNSNELYAAQGIADLKNFLRLRIDEDGDLTVYPVAVDRVPRQWSVRPGPFTAGERFVPTDAGLEARLIEDPVVVHRTPRGRTTRSGG